MSPTTNQIVLMTRLSARGAKHKALYARGISARYMHDGMHGSILTQRRSEPVARKRWAVLNHTYNLLLDKSVRRVRAARPSSAQAPSCSRLEAELQHQQITQQLSGLDPTGWCGTVLENSLSVFTAPSHWVLFYPHPPGDSY